MESLPGWVVPLRERETTSAVPMSPVPRFPILPIRGPYSTVYKLFISDAAGTSRFGAPFLCFMPKHRNLMGMSCTYVELGFHELQASIASLTLEEN